MALLLPHRFRNIIAALHDGCMAAASFVLALWLRLGSEQFEQSYTYLIPGTLIFTGICMAVFVIMRLYRGLWRYASLPDLVALAKAVSIAIGLFFIVMFAFTRLEGVPRSTPFINWLLLMFMLGGPRFLYRAAKDRTFHIDFRHDASKQIPLILVGGNDSAELFIRETIRHPRASYRVVGIVDNDPARRDKTIHGIRIYGNVESLPVIVAKLERKGLKPQRIILAEEDEGGEKTAKLLEYSETLGLPLGRLPDLRELKHDIADKQDIRPVLIEDLLGRPQNVHDRDGMRALITGKRVLVTGAGGSIGSELARQAASLAPSLLILFDQCEYALYTIDREMADRFPGVPRLALLGDVRARETVLHLFTQHAPQLVFHAAAVKHVPLSEANPLEAISTNALGTRNVADACCAHNVQAMVLISTDKAVNPTNVMGATKRLAESYCQALGLAGKSDTRFLTVRFGNVLGSTGSVVPLFKEQLEAGGPLTVTHPDMVRYFMTIREAVELVIQAAALGLTLAARREAIFVLDMGKPVRIVDLAMQMIRLAGLKPGKDIEIAYTGLRPGEKLFEELFYDAEHVERTSHKSILLAQAREASLESLEKSLAELGNHCKERGADAALALLKNLVPEFRCEQDNAAAA